MLTIMCSLLLTTTPIATSHQCLNLMRKGQTSQAFELLANADEVQEEVVVQVADSLLRSGLTSKNPDIQLAALFGASLSQSSDLVRYALVGLQSSSPEVQLAALSLLPSGNAREAEQHLKDSLRSDFLLIRLEALWLMASLRIPSAYDQLEALYAKMPDEVRALLLPLFAQEGSSRSQDFLSHILRSSSKELQAPALFALATIPTREKSPLSNPPFLDPLTLESFLAYAATHKDSVPTETIEQYTKHANEFVRLAALNVLAQNNYASQQKLEALQNPYASALLATLPLSDNSSLYRALNHPEEAIRINAGLALLAHKKAESFPVIIEILKSHSEDSFFVPNRSPGGTMCIWMTTPALSIDGDKQSYAQEQSLRFREQVLVNSLSLPEKQFLQIADCVAKSAPDLIPLLSNLLENKSSEQSKEWLKKTYQESTSILMRLYAAKSLVVLREEGPWTKNLIDWLESQKGLQLFRPRPLLPWFAQPEPKLQELTLDERARLSMDALSALIQSNEPGCRKLLLNWMKSTDLKTQLLLAGILLNLN